MADSDYDGDQRIMMGFLQSNASMCFFNAANLGWYANKAFEVSPLIDEVWKERIMGVTDYNHTSTKAMLVKIKMGVPNGSLRVTSALWYSKCSTSQSLFFQLMSTFVSGLVS